MSKNPHVKWYTGDYLVGIIGMSWEEQGRYSYLLNLQHQRGHLDIPKLMPDCPQSVLSKFVLDSDGLYYNVRMEEEIIKAREYSESRARNRAGGAAKDMSDTSSTRVEHMDNDNDNNNDNSINSNIIDIVNYLNEKAGTAYRPNTRNTIAKINARLADGYSVQDFYTVIDKKCADWIGTEQEKYLRPETLFGNKFENYLNQRTTNRSRNKFAALLEQGGF